MSLGTNGEKKSRSYKIVMVLIALMFVIQTIRSGCGWYRGWLGFIKLGGTSDDALYVLEGGEPTPGLITTGAVEDLTATLRLGIADSIMV